MAGHNKWSQIKHKKAKEDAKRGKAFTKLIKEITVSARDGGGDPNTNAPLRMLLEKAKSINMPLENSVRAIKRGTGELPGTHYESFTYEGYGPHGIAIIVEALSDNKNRTVADLRRLFSSKGGTMVESGAVSWMFALVGNICVKAPRLNEDDLLEKLISFDITDIRSNNETLSIVCNPKSVEEIKRVLQTIANITIESADIEWKAKEMISLADRESDIAIDFLSLLHDHDDVKNVYTNLA